VIAFFLSLIPLAAIDGSSAARPAILALILGSKNRPVLSGAMYVAGTFAVYMALSLAFVLGLGAAFEKMASSAGGGALDRLRNPENIDYTISLIIGLLLLLAAWHFSKPPQPKPDKTSKGFTPRGAFILGAASNAIVGPGILPSFAAWNQIMKSPYSAATCLVLLIIYNFLVVSPLVFLVVLRATNKEKADRVFAAISRFFAVWGRRTLVFLFALLGIVMIADAIGFYLGHPLLPTGSESNTS
jgi:cytochrome c biogenesis protein CcdA